MNFKRIQYISNKVNSGFTPIFYIYNLPFDLDHHCGKGSY